MTTTNTMTTVAVRTIVVATALAGTLAGPVAVGTAQARGGGEITHRGQCSGAATWKLAVKHDDGRLEVEWEIDSDHVGQIWTVRMRDNHTLFFSGHRTTRAPSGSISITKFTANRAGSDHIRVRSVHNSQVCTGTLTV